MILADFFTENPYSLSSQEKQPKLLAVLNKLTAYHSQHCPEYRRILQALGHQTNAETIPHSFPMLPVRLFKLLNLASISEEQIVKTLTSSGTTSQAVSTIYLDSETAFRQTQALTSIITSFIGKKRLPMIFVDNQTSIQRTWCRSYGNVFFWFRSFLPFGSGYECALARILCFFGKTSKTAVIAIRFYIYDLEIFLSGTYPKTKKAKFDKQYINP